MIVEVTAIVGAIGGLAGVTGFATVLAQKRKLKADAADVLTDTALQLIEPLRKELAGARAEAEGARDQTKALYDEVGELRESVRELTSTLTRWRRWIFEVNEVERIRQLVHADAGNYRNGTRPN